MNQIDTKRRYLEMQGFTGLDDATLVAVDPWLRLAPALCMIGVGLGTIAASGWILWGFALLAIAGTIFGSHPFDALYKHGVRRLTGGPRLPVYGAARRFSCAVGALWLTATGYAFHEGASLVAYSLGGVMFALAELQVLTGFCVPSWIYSKLIDGNVDRGEIPAPSASIDR